MQAGFQLFISGAPFELSVTIRGLGIGQRVSGSYSEAPRLFFKGDPKTSVVKGGEKTKECAAPALDRPLRRG